MNKIFFLLAVVLLIAAIYMFFKSRQAKAASTQETGDTFSKDYFAEAKGQNEFNPENLGPGAIIRYGATDYVVRGTLTLITGTSTCSTVEITPPGWESRSMKASSISPGGPPARAPASRQIAAPWNSRELHIVRTSVAMRATPPPAPPACQSPARCAT